MIISSLASLNCNGDSSEGVKVISDTTESGHNTVVSSFVIFVAVSVVLLTSDMI
jgi:hypothetical protein